MKRARLVLLRGGLGRSYLYDGDGAKNITPQVIHVEGDPDHPTNRGTLCPKGSSLEQDRTCANEYASGPTATLGDEIMKGFARTAATAAPDADVTEVAHAIVRVVDAPFGKRPFRVHIDPSSDGAEVVNAVADRVRVELLRNMGLADLQHPTSCTS